MSGPWTSRPYRSAGAAAAAVAMAVLVGCSAAESSTTARSAPAPSSTAAEAVDPSGVYRAEVDPQKMVAAGIPEAEAARNSGVVTLTLTGGALRVSGQPGEPDCTGTYTTSGNRLAITLDNVNCSGDGSMTFAVDGQTLRFSDFTPADDVLDRVFWTGQPWQRAA